MKKRIVILLLTCLSTVGFAQNSVNKKVKDIFDSVSGKFPNDEETQSAQCKCVRPDLCGNTGGVGIINLKENDGKCESYLHVCCNMIDLRETPIASPPPAVKGCGFRNPDGYGFRLAGDQNNEAQYGEFPWMIGVLTEEHNANTATVLDVYKCGGSLIHPQAVVTAAHCVASRDKKYKIRAGEWDTQTTNELYPHQERYVKSFVRHEDFYSGGLYNDIAILFLDRPLNITGPVNTLCLPEQDVVIPTGTRCFATGWGKNVFGKQGTYQVILKKIELPMVDFNTCENQLKTARQDERFSLDRSFVCAGGEPGKDTCKGDGGSPLACPIPGQSERYQHVGMVAWGIGCGEKGIPGVYVNVAMFRDWIDGHMMQHHLDRSHYQIIRD